MSTDASFKHDFNTSLILIRMTSERMRAAIENMLEYIEEKQAYDVITITQIEILRKSAATLLEHTKKLEVASEHVIFPDNGEKL